MSMEMPLPMDAGDHPTPQHIEQTDVTALAAVKQEGQEVARLQPHLQMNEVPNAPWALVSGDPAEWATKLDGSQGDNIFGAKGNCGLVSIANLLTMSGRPTSETEVTGHALTRGECSVSLFDGDSRGGTNYLQRIEILNEYGISSQAFAPEQIDYESMAAAVEDGHGMILALNLYMTEPGFEQYATVDEYGNAAMDHAVCVTGVARDATTGEVAGFYVCDSGANNPMKYIGVDRMDSAWKNVSGANVMITDQPIRA